MSKLIKCNACGKDIAKGVKKCPHCGNDQRGFFMKHKIITAFLIFFGLCILGAMFGEGSSTSSGSSASANPVEKSSEKIIEAKIGDQVDIGHFSYVVQKIFFRKTVGNEFMRQTADGIYLLVSLSMINNDNKPHTVDNSLFCRKTRISSSLCCFLLFKKSVTSC